MNAAPRGQGFVHRAEGDRNREYVTIWPERADGLELMERWISSDLAIPEEEWR